MSPRQRVKPLRYLLERTKALHFLDSTNLTSRVSLHVVTREDLHISERFGYFVV